MRIESKVRTITTQPDDTNLITVIPTTLLRLSWEQAERLVDTLAEKTRPNPFVDNAQFDSIDTDWFWIDLEQLVREAPDMAEDVKAYGCIVCAGCRVNTSAAHWLQWLAQQLEEGMYQRGGTSWVNLHYAVIAAKAKKVYADMVNWGTGTPTCVRQRELPISSLHAVPPVATWKRRSTSILFGLGEQCGRKSDER